MISLALGNGFNSTINPGNANSPITGEDPCKCIPTDDLRNYLLTLQSQKVQSTTSSSEFSGILLAVKIDYIVLVENLGSLVLIPISNIRTVAKI